MRKLLLLLLASGMFACAFAQPEVSDKWVITPVTNMKGVLGMLDINFPGVIERDILIYQQTDNKFLRSVSRNDKTYTIAPGEYRFTLTNVPVENVPIKKGHQTRLKAGFLDIVSEGDWHLHDETKGKAYTSGNKPKKLALPVGSYQIKLGGQFYPVIIKDGETVEDYTQVEIKDEPYGLPSPSAIEIPAINTSPWTISPFRASGPVPGKGDEGRLDLNFPGDSSWSMTITKDGTQETITLNGSQYFNSSNNSYSLPAGVYDIKLNNVPLDNVPISSRQITKIKVGYFSIKYVSPYGAALQIKSYVHKLNSSYSSAYFMIQGGFQKLMPVGPYGLRIWGDHPAKSIIVRENQDTHLEIITSSLTINAYAGNWALCNADNTITPCYFYGGNGPHQLYLPVGSYRVHHNNKVDAVTVLPNTQNSFTIQ